MKLLADENIDPPLIVWLRSQGHDVLSVAESHSGSGDADLLNLAEAEGRILLTFDKDFADLTFRQRVKSPGIVHLRIRASNRDQLFALFASSWKDVEAGAVGSFTVVLNHAIRRRPIS